MILKASYVIIRKKTHFFIQLDRLPFLCDKALFVANVRFILETIQYKKEQMESL